MFFSKFQKNYLQPYKPSKIISPWNTHRMSENTVQIFFSFFSVSYVTLDT